jgi:hypothetical protein
MAGAARQIAGKPLLQGRGLPAKTSFLPAKISKLAPNRGPFRTTLNPAHELYWVYHV